MDIIDTKILVACLFGIVRFIFGILPYKLYRCLKIEERSPEADAINARRSQLVHCCLGLFQAFGGGVIFATCFLRMMPEVYETTIVLKNHGLINSQYPFSQLIVSLGFFLVYFIEEMSQWLITVLGEKCKKNGAKKTVDTSSIRSITPSNKVDPEYTEIVSIIEDFSTPFNELKETEKEIEAKESEENEDELDLPRTKDFEQVEELDKLIEDGVSVSSQQILRGMLLVLALSLHAFLEGLAIGLQASITSIWYLFIAVSIHSAATLFVVGLELLLAKTKMRTIVIHVLILSVTSPFGILLGLLISVRTDMNTKTNSVAVSLLEGLSAGTILYITFFEVLNREKDRKIYRLRRAVFILFGFGMMALFECIDMNSHHY